MGIQVAEGHGSLVYPVAVSDAVSHSWHCPGKWRMKTSSEFSLTTILHDPEIGRVAPEVVGVVERTGSGRVMTRGVCGATLFVGLLSPPVSAVRSTGSGNGG